MFHAKKTLLFSKGKSLIKKHNNDDLFDIPMGSFDGAEACELVVSYLLSELNDKLSGTSLGLYRDDGLAISHGTPRQIENIK